MDAQMRDIKTHARYRSKEMWYAWRSQLLEDLMKALQGIGEGLIRDDEVLQRAEEILEQVLPGLVEQQESLRVEAEQFELEAAATSKEEKEELAVTRERLQAVDVELEEKQKMLEELQRKMQEHETQANDLEENRAEFAAAIKEADRVKESCRSVSTHEINELKGTLFTYHNPYILTNISTHRIRPPPRTNPLMVHPLRLLLANHNNSVLQTPTPTLLPPPHLQQSLSPQRPDQLNLHRPPAKPAEHNPPLLPPTPPRLAASTTTVLNTRSRTTRPREQRLGYRARSRGSRAPSEPRRDHRGEDSF